MIQEAARKRALRDLAVCGAVVIAGAVLFALFDIVERIEALTAAFEHAELDDLLLALVLALVMAGWFAARRWNDARAYVVRLEQLSSELLTAEERERHRIADLVHDDLGQALYAARLRLSVLTQRLPEGELRELSSELEELTGEALTRARDLSMQLSPPALSDLGLAEALETLLPVLSRRYRVHIALEPSTAFARIPEAARAPAFHSVQELVMNAIKHAGASRVEVTACEQERAVEVCVVDDGRGFDAAAREGRAGFGLFSIERRMAYLDARLELRSAPGEGTRATLRIPV